MCTNYRHRKDICKETFRFLLSLQKVCPMQLTLTGDGSHTLFVPHLNEHYHSTYGAITESMHVFIRNGLELLTERVSIAVFEAGFGTGLNALLTAMNAIDRGIRVIYYAVEKYPVDPEMAARLNYPELLSLHEGQADVLFTAIHQAPWNQLTIVHPCYHLHKIRADLSDFVPEFNYDLIYFDAFAPDKQPEMWTGEILHRLCLHLDPGGIFTTYCAKGSIRRLLMECGLDVKRIPGPPGKREILRGEKK
jgi:tRNA U34 5-methylaminomethyl-2-thiouridine-forming methyltransferase MnmC